ncbi:ABC transporter permease [Nocardia sp. NPDC050630]|uniref:ABC transporter permease n=1 Tax=Nocardia sp. NPDC050630 TaxID=3364321 RepID=UPI00379F3117
MSPIHHPRTPTRFGLLAVTTLGLAFGVAVWQFVGSRDPVLVNTPTAAAAAVRDMADSGVLVPALLSSGLLFLVGLLSASVVGMTAGLLMARNRRVRLGTEWLLHLCQAVPIVAITPIVLAAVGFGVGPKSFVVFFSAVFPIAINTIEGAKRVPSRLLDVTHTYRSPEWRIWIDLLVPHTLPYAMSGIRQGIAMAVVGTLAAEFFLNASGIGGLLLAASARFDSAAVLGLTVVVAAIAVTLIGFGLYLERHMAPWRQVGAR